MRRSFQTMQEGSAEYNRCILYNEGDLCAQLKLTISPDLQTRRLQLLGYKLYAQCAKGYRGIKHEDLIKRTQFINQRYKSTLTPEQVGQMCRLKHTPSAHPPPPHKYSKLLYMSEPELEALDILEQTSHMNHEFINNMLLGHLTNPWFELQLNTVVRDFHANFWVTVDVQQAYLQTIINTYSDAYMRAYTPNWSIGSEQATFTFIDNAYRDVQNMTEQYGADSVTMFGTESEEYKFHKYLRESAYYDLIVYYMHLDNVSEEFVFTIDQAVFLMLAIWLRTCVWFQQDVTKLIKHHVGYIVKEIFPDIVYMILHRESLNGTHSRADVERRHDARVVINEQGAFVAEEEEEDENGGDHDE